jgi:CRISPR/Cas system endoribonuclease Cas6 (RAMP superfamily)
MYSTVIKIDLSTQKPLKKQFIGGSFRGWLGYSLKCDPHHSCSKCEDIFDCPYFMIFKEHSEVRPYSVLAFNDRNYVRGFIRIHGEKRKLVPKILSAIQNKEKAPHFSGHKYFITSIEAKNLEIKPVKMSGKIRFATVSPVCLMHSGRIETLPSFNTILRSCIRSYNRISKYYDSKNYPYHVSEEILSSDAEIIDFDVHAGQYQHKSMDGKNVKLYGVEGWIEYDTSHIPDEAAMILGMGESLQIGKHTAYGFGGFVILDQ